MFGDGVAWRGGRGEERERGGCVRMHDAMTCAHMMQWCVCVCVCVCMYTRDMHGPSSVRPMRAVTAGCHGKRMLRVDAKLVVPFAEVA